MAEPIISFQNVCMYFGGVKAIDNISFDVEQGKIFGIIGPNGAGKTTLMRVLYGMYTHHEGTMLINGEKVAFSSPKDAISKGIGMVHQHFKLVDILTAAENIILGLPGKQILNMKQVNKEILELAAKYGFEIDPKKKIYQM